MVMMTGPERPRLYDLKGSRSSNEPTRPIEPHPAAIVDRYSGPRSDAIHRLPPAVVDALWQQPGLAASETACQPAHEPFGDTSKPIVADASGEMTIALNGLYGQGDQRRRWFSGANATALDATRIKAITGGTVPSGAALQRFIQEHPEVVLKKIGATPDPKDPSAPLSGVASFRAPPGHEVLCLVDGGQAQGMVANSAAIQSPVIRDAVGAKGPGARPSSFGFGLFAELLSRWLNARR